MQLTLCQKRAMFVAGIGSSSVLLFATDELRRKSRRPERVSVRSTEETGDGRSSSLTTFTSRVQFRLSSALRLSSRFYISASGGRRKMCPMRFLLVFFSLIVAAYLACKTYWMTGTEDAISSDQKDGAEEVNERDSAFKRVYAKISSGMWCLVDMLSGRYLWFTLTSRSKQL
ncbi:hypothetical protein KP509_16G049500 [Ceratopteris richardii]|uniref:Uncharacterized protein n=1 Tax=Ceratopteris richardii TaxID=49495 RepID=A0A8T2SYQ3_CERRI|nr:hypothetical protein KP509_16G049500 [Ceratopteris richardii]